MFDKKLLVNGGTEPDLVLKLVDLEHQYVSFGTNSNITSFKRYNVDFDPTNKTVELSRKDLIDSLQSVVGIYMQPTDNINLYLKSANDQQEDNYLLFGNMCLSGEIEENSNNIVYPLLRENNQTAFMAFTERLTNTDNNVIEIGKGHSPLYSTISVSLSYDHPIKLGVQCQIKRNDDSTVLSVIEVDLEIQSSQQTIVNQKVELPFLEFDKGETYIFMYRYLFSGFDIGDAPSSFSPASTLIESASLNNNIIYQNTDNYLSPAGREKYFTYINAQELPNRLNIDLNFNLV